MRHWKPCLLAAAFALCPNLHLSGQSTTNDLETDGRIGAFRQHRTGDCFFLVSILALSNDTNGRSLVEGILAKHPTDEQWQITFASHPDNAVAVTRTDLAEHRLFNARGTSRSAGLATGDGDVRLLEIAADRLWVETDVKDQGLWDDVPMNALAMFTTSPQQLIWNRSKASPVAQKDIAKSDRLPPNRLLDRQVDSREDAESALKSIVDSDAGGLSMTLMDYRRYHGLAIIDIDFDERTYSYLDPLRGTDRVLKASLDTLIDRIVAGQYAINYVEVAADSDAN